MWYFSRKYVGRAACEVVSMTWLELLIPALVLFAGLPCVAVTYVFTRASNPAWGSRLLAFLSAVTGVSIIMAMSIFLRVSGLVSGFLPFFIAWNLSFALCAAACRNAIGVAFAAIGQKWARNHSFLFWSATAAAYVANLLIALSKKSDLFFPYIQGAFSATSVYLFAALGVSLLILLLNRRRLAQEDLRTLDRFLYIFLPLGAVLFLDELLRITRWIDIPRLPLIPLSSLFLYCFTGAEILVRMRQERKKGSFPPAGMSFEDLASVIADSCAASPLTRRERDVLLELVKGASNAEIGKRLGISPHTVKNHVYSVYQKTGAGSRKELYSFAARERQPYK
jgi:DNA-binding CsgD family transcriptional regulator